jgi:NTE family protein
MAMMRRQWESPEVRTRAIAEFTLNTRTNSAALRLLTPWVFPRTNGRPELCGSPQSDTATCELCVFNAQSGIGLIEAVAASCAVPGVRTPRAIKGRLYMDSGLWRNAESAHLARGERSVLIVSPFGARMTAAPQSLQGDTEERRSGSRVALIAGDDEALSTVGAGGPLDPSIRAAAAAAGRAQGRRELEKIRAWLG